MERVKIFFAEEKKNGRGSLGNEKIFFAENKNGEGKEGKYHGEGKIVAGRDGWTGRKAHKDSI